MQNKPLKDYKCDELLIKYDAVKNISNEYESWHEPKNEEDKNGELAVTMFINIIVNILAVISAWSGMNELIRGLAVILFIPLFIYLIVCANKYCEAHKKIKGKPEPKLDEMLLTYAKEKMRYTGIVRVVYVNKGEFCYLVGKDFFLPHCNLDFERGINEQEKGIKQCLREFEILEKDILTVTPVDDSVHYSIKPIRGNVQMNAFVFYDVTIKEQVKKKITQSNSIRKWVSIEEMKKNTEAISTNKDVIDLIDSFPAPKESFENILGDYKIIWNITSKCSYNCAICATYDENRQELSAIDKLKVLNNICSAEHMIESIDFAGGDPLYFEECTHIIQSAIDRLGSDRISITTTGKGISEASRNEFLGIVKHCEITIDAAHANLSMVNNEMDDSVSRAEAEYTDNNIEEINLISERAESLTINIPIINDDLSDEEIDVLIDKILWIRNHTTGIEIDTSILRLMPVGKMKDTIKKAEYSKYNPVPVAKKIKEKLDSNKIPCKLHCSLRILPAFNQDVTSNYCQMYENKLGIDCAGNVFACAWGGYLTFSNSPIKNIPTKNPFYLGNLTKTPLIKILNNESRTTQSRAIFTEIENRNLRNYCSVVSYYMNKELFKNSDSLSKV